jgi:hypothetical protein
MNDLQAYFRDVVKSLYAPTMIQGIVGGIIATMLCAFFVYIYRKLNITTPSKWEKGAIYAGTTLVTLLVWWIAIQWCSRIDNKTAAKAEAPKPPPAPIALAKATPIATPLNIAPADLIAQVEADNAAAANSQFATPFFDYTDTFVSWTLYLSQARTTAQGTLELVFTDYPDSQLRIYCTADQTTWGYLTDVKIERNTQQFQVTGTIERIGSSDIWLTDMPDIQVIKQW